ncbi:hypothetical protein LV457_02830 [Mycobacterium sp. MYCO198283]|uniref:hypothetical protein n=1 Tax=Mycobacterium sp. MYCO198283 TaxID=2883505 RepID=UPI001E563C1C|nr:hypothetical protein [Mycobacterium sp. MYCO198283]MCG5431224.1 hypothetical protein [Mycobacterium sp. MYCO198283]
MTRAATLPDEVEVYVGPDLDRFATTRFGRVGTAPRFVDGEPVEDVPPIVLFVVDCVAAALQDRQCRRSWARCRCRTSDVTTTATRDGFVRISTATRTWVWELYPVRWSHGRNQPPCYLGVWRD